jgi:signal transduction histidine kinase
MLAPTIDATKWRAYSAPAVPVMLTPRVGAGAASATPAPADPTTDNVALKPASQQAVTELLLLGALREATRADAANAARLTVEHAHASLARFLAEMGHELRTPLQAVGGYADLMAMGIHGPVTDQQRIVLERIHAGVVHLVELTTALVDHARIAAGHVDYVMTAVRVGSAMDAAGSLIVPQADARAITLTVEQCDDQLAVHADAGKLRQVLVNLLANAVKFTEPGGAVTMSAQVTVVPTTDTIPSVAISVTDTGCGISADDLGRVFEPFVQVGPRSDAHKVGVGLGLAISRDLTRGMGGSLTVESTPGVGTTFTLTLPQAA